MHTRACSCLPVHIFDAYPLTFTAGKCVCQQCYNQMMLQKAGARALAPFIGPALGRVSPWCCLQSRPNALEQRDHWSGQMNLTFFFFQMSASWLSTGSVVGYGRSTAMVFSLCVHADACACDV